MSALRFVASYDEDLSDLTRYAVNLHVGFTWSILSTCMTICLFQPLDTILPFGHNTHVISLSDTEQSYNNRHHRHRYNSLRQSQDSRNELYCIVVKLQSREIINCKTLSRQSSRTCGRVSTKHSNNNTI